MIFRRFSTCAVTAILILSQPVLAETVSDPMSWTLRSSLDLKAEDGKVRVAYASVFGAYEAFMPTAAYSVSRTLTSRVSYEPDPNALLNIVTGLNTIQNREPNVYGVQISLPVFDGFRRYNDLQAAKSQFEAQRHVREARSQDLMLDAVGAYLSVLRDRAVMSARKQQIAALGEIRKAAATKSAVHDATVGDEALAQSRVEAAEAALEQAQANLDASQIEINRLAGSDVSSRATHTRTEAFVPHDVQAVVSRVRATNPKIIAARLAAEAAGHSARSAYADFLPQANIVFLHSELGANSPTYFKTKDTTVLAQFKIPIYTPGEFANVSRARALAQQKGYEAEDVEALLVAKARTQLSSYRALQRQVGQVKRRIASLSRAVESLKKEQNLGTRTIIDVLNVVDERSEATVTLANVEFARDRAAYALANLMNELDPSSRDGVRYARVD